MLNFLFILAVIFIIPFAWNMLKRFSSYESRKVSETIYSSIEDAGQSQWKDFTLTSTPDIIKKGVTDISKYYV
jgi:hypothetical protein